MFQAVSSRSAREKALRINLDETKYGTIVEIGAGQEVARQFFKAGAAAGTIAKTMSAYDMTFSNAIYGVQEDRRYVSKSRVKSMIEQEFDLVINRVGTSRPDASRFFAYGATVEVTIQITNAMLGVVFVFKCIQVQNHLKLSFTFGCVTKMLKANKLHWAYLALT